MTGFVVKLERSNYMPAYLRMICMVSQDFPAEYDIYENISFVHQNNQLKMRRRLVTTATHQALGKDKKIWSTQDKYDCYDSFPEKRCSRMLSIPIMAEENNTWDLQDARNFVKSLFYNQKRRERRRERSSIQCSAEACTGGVVIVSIIPNIYQSKSEFCCAKVQTQFFVFFHQLRVKNYLLCWLMRWLLDQMKQC